MKSQSNITFKRIPLAVDTLEQWDSASKAAATRIAEGWVKQGVFGGGIRIEHIRNKVRLTNYVGSRILLVPLLPTPVKPVIKPVRSFRPSFVEAKPEHTSNPLCPDCGSILFGARRHCYECGVSYEAITA